MTRLAPLKPCPLCTEPVSTRAVSCPKCGEPRPHRRARADRLANYGGSMIAIGLGAAACFSNDDVRFVAVAILIAFGILAAIAASIWSVF